MVGTVKKSIAAMASRWFRRKASQCLAGSGSVGARRIQREIVRSETSKPSMRSSPWMSGAPQVGFSRTIRKINSQTSLDVCLLPTRILTREISLQYELKLVRCHRTTVSGVTMMRACFHPDQNRRTATQKSLAKRLRPGRGRRRFSTASCWRSTKFSKTRLPRLQNRRASAPNHKWDTLNIAWSYTKLAAGRLLQTVDSAVGQSFWRMTENGTVVTLK